MRGFFGFVGAGYLRFFDKLRMTIKHVMKILQHLQRQCKYYRFKHNDCKNRERTRVMEWG